MNINNAMKLLGLMTILTIASVTIPAYAAVVTPTVINSITVNPNDSLDVVCTDPTFDAGETIQGRELLIDNDLGFGSPEVTVGGPADLASLTCDGSTINNVSFTGNYNDFDTINVKLTVYDDGANNSFATTTFDVADNTKPIVNAPATPSTELTNIDGFDESTCNVTDNDVTYGIQSCIITGSINTSILGLQSVDFDGNADAASNVPDTVTRTVTIVDTTVPILTRDQSNPIDLVKNVDPVPSLTVTVTDNDNTVNGDTVSCDTSSVDNTVLGPYIATCDFTDPSGNPAVQVTYTVNVIAGNPPVISLTGANPQTINLHDPYVELGATASDVEDIDLTGAIVIDSSAVDVDTLGFYTVTYDVTDSSGNTDHEERTVNVVTGGMPVITILGDNPANIPWGSTYSDSGATAFDAEDLDLTSSIVTTGLGFDTTLTGGYLQAFSYSVTYTVTDSNGNTAQATRIVNVGLKPAPGSECAGDCYHPHFGVDQNGKTFYDDGLMIDNLQYKIDNVLHNPYSALYLNVGEPVTFKLKAMDNTANQIRHMELALSIPKGDFDKQKAQVIIDLNLGWDGKNTITYEGDKSLVKNVSSDVTKTDKTVTWALTLTPTQKLDHDMFALSVVDQYQYVGTYYINEGIKITGISQNGVPEFDYLDSMGYNHHLSIVDQTLEDLSVAIDEQGHKWTLDSKTQFWMKEFIRPDMKCSVSSLGYSRNCVTEFHEAKLVEQAKATEMFDSSTIQKKIDNSSTIMPGGYGRLHDPVPNMMKAYADYAISRAGHS